ncbi:uncharacterized protein LOC144459928, partial [Epinephelus lanceolatus]
LSPPDMAVNSSSSNDSLLPSNSTWDSYCLFIRPISFIFTGFNITRFLLLLPLCILVLYLGLQRWQRQRSTSTAAAMTHSDIFTYHMVAVELVGLLGCILSCCGVFWEHLDVFTVGYYLWAFTWYGEMFFHILTCVERYLAVVHPVTYLSLRGERGIRIRNISIGCVWLICVGATGLVTLEDIAILWDFCLLGFSLIIMSFCSLSVLCVLIRPGPGEQGGDTERVDESKRRAFYTIVAILGVLLLRCCGNMMWAALIALEKSDECAVMLGDIWFNVPSSLVLPLLFLHRAGKLLCCKTAPNEDKN